MDGRERGVTDSAMAALSDCDRDGGRCQSCVEDGQRVERWTGRVKGQIIN
jgi:hypothetical protein